MVSGQVSQWSVDGADRLADGQWFYLLSLDTSQTAMYRYHTLTSERVGEKPLRNMCHNMGLSHMGLSHMMLDILYWELCQKTRLV